MSELTRYSAVTPNRPETTCLIAERRESPFGSGWKRCGSTPPWPGFDLQPSRGDALDRRAHRIAVRQRLDAIGFLATLAGVRLAADPVHGDRERGMRLARDRAERHRAGREALHDVLGRLALLDRHRLAAVL